MKKMFGKREDGTWTPMTVWTSIIAIALIINMILGYNTAFFLWIVIIGLLTYFATSKLRQTTEEKETHNTQNSQKELQEINRKNSTQSHSETTLTSIEKEMFEELSQEFTDKEYDPAFTITFRNFIRTITFQKLK